MVRNIHQEKGQMQEVIKEKAGREWSTGVLSGHSKWAIGKWKKSI